MQTMQEHTDWLKQHGDNILIKYTEGAWTAMIILNDGYTFEAGDFIDIDECTRELCDLVCTHLGEKCK
jgi:hypothetical protein